MRSAIHFKGHPVHPMLIPFPIAFFTGTFVCDLIALILSHTSWAFIASRLAIAGIAMALVAAVPGLVDYFKAVPPNSTGKSRATKHMLLNITVVVLFLIALILRGVAMMPTAPTMILEAIGFGCLATAGWMGGTLAYRNQIGVDHRYAGAGKWKVESLTKRTNEIVVAKEDELKLNQMKLVEVDGKRIVIGRKEDGLVAFDDRCSHRGGSLADGAMICGTVQCPWHGSQFDCSTGRVKAGPATSPIVTYVVVTREDKVILTL